MTGTVVDRLAQCTQAQGARCAIDAAGDQLTYARLEELASRAAGALAAAGIGRGDRVGLLFEREVSGVVALFGILKSGACAVPLPASDPFERVQRIVHDAGLRMVVVGDTRSAAAAALGTAARSLETLAAAGGSPALPSVSADDLAMVLYTSGTTGRPKGVAHSHRMVLHKYVRLNTVLQVGTGDRLPMFATFATAQGINAVNLALLSGATLCPFDLQREGLSRLTAWMEDGRLTVWESSATLLRNCMRAVGEDRQFPGLRVVRIGGERVMPADIGAAERVFPSARLYVMYSATETGGICLHAVERDKGYPAGIVPVGRPLGGMTVRILDEEGRDRPDGEEGEIAVGGTIADGYWGDPELTAMHFVSRDDGLRPSMYRTGDVGRWTADGELEHLGRRDRRVKIRGFRVELEEVETVVSEQVDVIAAAVAVKPGPDGDPRLVGYVQPVPGSGLTVETLRTELGVRLPEHMIPSAFVFLDRLPLTASGKIARQLLPEPPPERPALGSSLVDPRSPLEADVAAVWREVLGLHAVGVYDDFFALGGDSLKASMVASRLASKIGVTVPLTVLLEASTIAELSCAIESRLER